MEKRPIDKWLLKNGMTQKELAKVTNYTEGHLSLLLNGKKNLSVRFVKALKKVIPNKIVDEHFGL